MPGFRLNRRGFLGSLTTLAASIFSGQKTFAATDAAPATASTKLTGLGSTGNIYAELGLPTPINAHLTETVYGGSIIRPEAIAVMEQAAKHFVVMMDLEAVVGKKVCEMLHLPAGYAAIVTSGAASAIQNGYAGIITGSDPAKIKLIPDIPGPKPEVLIQHSHAAGWDHQIRATGAKVIEVVTVDDVHRAINERTIAMHFQNLSDGDGKINRADWLKLAHDNHLPAFLDMAADVPPKSRLWEYANMGYDLITISGGKAIRGPQVSGLLMGRAELVQNALLNMSPNEDTLGRPCKIGKEELLGFLKALEVYLAEDEDAVRSRQAAQMQVIETALAKIPGLTFDHNETPVKNHFPTLHVHMDPKRFSATGREIATQLAAANPPIVVGGSRGGIEMTAIDLQPGEEKIVAEALAAVLTAHSI